MTDGTSTPGIIYAANRRIGIECLRLILKAGLVPVALLVPSGKEAEATDEMEKLLPGVPVFRGKDGLAEATSALPSLAPQYLISIHFPLILPPEILSIPSIGTLNLHPAFLPWNRGWHTPSWAILDGTPYGATLHWVNEGLDTGDIALQNRVEVGMHETAHALYQRALAAEVEVFRAAIPFLQKNSLPRIPQQGKGTTHRKSALEAMRKIDLDKMSNDEVLKRLRALTTNRPEEAAYMEEGGKRYRIRLDISSETPQK